MIRHRSRSTDIARGFLGDVDWRASIVASAAALVLTLAIYVGSGGLQNFDAALVGYATATIFLAFGITYRYAVWVGSPPAGRYLRRGWRSFLLWSNFRRRPGLVPRQIVSYLSFQTFIRERGVGRWAADQAVFWGCVLAALITFPLTFGWVHFRAADTETGYTAYFFGVRTFSFDALSLLGWLTFHGLDVAALLVIAGSVYFLVRRFRDREAMTDQSLWYDLLPLVALIVISVTGLLLTFSSVLLEGAYYDFLALIHMGAVVLTLVFIPFGKFFHIVQRPASVGVQVYKASTLDSEGVFECRRCGAPIESNAYIGDLQRTMSELGLEYESWIEYCPRCKRIARGAAYRSSVKEGFK